MDLCNKLISSAVFPPPSACQSVSTGTCSVFSKTVTNSSRYYYFLLNHLSGKCFFLFTPEVDFFPLCYSGLRHRAGTSWVCISSGFSACKYADFKVCWLTTKQGWGQKLCHRKRVNLTFMNNL